MRTQTALALAGVHRPVETGSAELNWLATDDKRTAASITDQAFFYEARLSAAQAVADPQIRVQLLRNALADTPARDEARIPLFQAAAGLRSDEFARGVIEPLLLRQFLNRAPPAVPRGEEAITSSDDESDSDAGTASTQAQSPFKLPASQQAQVARSLGELMARLNRLDEALRYLAIARKLETAPDRRKEISGTITDTSARLRRQQLNAARQPILHEALEQDRLVRPRLLALSVPPAAVKKGTKP